MNASRIAVTVVAALTTLAFARVSRAEELEVGLGVGVTAASSQVQADLELHRRLALEIAAGQPIAGERSVSAGGRLYITRTFLAPYVGVLASEQTDRAFDGTPLVHDYAGPTFGLRLRGRRFGAFGEAEVLRDRDANATYVLPGVGVQYFF